MQAEQPASIANVAPVEMERDGAIASQSAQLDTSRLTILEKPDGTAEVAAASGREAAERERALQDQLDQVKQTLALTQQRLKAQEAEAEASKAATAQLQRELLSSQQQLKAAGVEMGKAATTREMSLRAELEQLRTANEKLSTELQRSGAIRDERTVVHADVTPELQPLQQHVATPLAHLQKASNGLAEVPREEATKLPEALRSFTPLAEEPSIERASKGLHELELAVARAPDSEEAVAASGPSDPR